MSNQNGLNLDKLPTIQGEFQIAREAPKQKRDGGDLDFISLDVQTPEPVAFPRNDGQEPRSSKQRFRVEVSRDRYPEAFEELQNASLGSIVQLKARLFSRSGRVGDYPQRLAAFEATDAKVVSTIVRTDDPA